MKKELTDSTGTRVLTKAASLFAEKGYADTSVRDIAKESGISASVLYHYFHGKQHLYTQVLEHEFQGFRAMMVKKAFAMVPGEDDELSFFLKEQIKALHASPLLVRMVAWEAVENPERGGGISLKYFDELVGMLIRMLRRAIGDNKRLDLEITALTAAGITGFFFFNSGAVKHALRQDSYDDEFIERLCRNAIELFYYGIRGKKE